MIRYIQLFCILFFANYIFGQTGECFIIEKNNVHVAGSYKYIPKEKVELLPGFEYVATSSNSLTIGIDPFKICTLNTDKNVVGNNGQQPTYQHNNSLPVGAIPGVAGVSPTGAATYTIPLFVSPGINGMEPQLSISYNSHSGDGILGLGWSLNGLSAITISPNMLYNDGYSEAIKVLDTKHNQFISNLIPEKRYKFRYALDGNPLVCVEGNYGEDGSYYKTENETFSKIRYNPRNFFTVETKTGEQITYGFNDNSRLLLNCSSDYEDYFNNDPVVNLTNNKAAYYINEIRDMNDNYMTYEYYDRSGEKLIKRITYYTLYSTSHNVVEFYYGERSDKSFGYFVSPYKSTQTVLLEKIKVISEGQLVKEYVFKYFEETELSNNGTEFIVATKLSEIVEKDGNGEQLNSTVIEWGAKGTRNDQYFPENCYWMYIQPALDENSTFLFKWYHDEGQPETTYHVGDFNGDGLLDFCYVYNFRIHSKRLLSTKYKYYSFLGTYINNGDGTFNFYNRALSGDSEKPEYRNLFVGDGDYDGIDEIYLVSTMTIQTDKCTWNSTTNSWDCSWYVDNVFGFDNLTRLSFYSGNITGDGKKQLIATKKEDYSKNNIHHVTWIEGGWWFEEYYLYNYERFNYAPVACDFDGDGITDFIDIFEEKFGVYEYDPNENFKLKLQHEISTDILNFAYMTDFRVGDFNGDGKSDIIVRSKNLPHQWKVYFSDGLRFVYSGKTLIANNDKKIYVCDINGDGKDDVIVEPNDGDIWVYISKGDGSFFSKNYPIDYNPSYENKYNIAFGDFNDDGINDILFGIQERCIIYGYNDDQSKRILSITDGMTNKTEFAYKPLNSEIGGKADIVDNTYPLYNNLQVVETLKQSNGLVSNNNENLYNTTYYNYKKGRIHIEGKGFLGFDLILTFSFFNTVQAKIINDFNLTNGRLTKTTVENYIYNGSNSELTSKQETEYIYRQMMSGNSNYAAMLPKTQKAYDYLLHSGNSTITTYKYINESSGVFYGNLNNITVNQSGIYTTKTKYINYLTDDYCWSCNFLPQIIQKTQTKSGETVGTQTTLTYNPNKIWQVQSSVSESYPTAGEKPLTTNFTYYTFGGISSISQTGIYNMNGENKTRTTYYMYDSKGKFVSEVTDAAGLKTEYKYDHKFGNIIWQKDQLGNEITYEYDGFGNLKETVTPLSTTTITRNWETNFAANLAFSETVSTSGKAPTTTWHDILGRGVKTKGKLYNKDIYTKTEYNSDGNVIKESLPYFGSNPDKWKTYTYDNYKRIKNITALDLTTNTSYSSASTTTSYPDGIVATKTYNAVGETTQISSQNGTITYEYNTFGSPVEITAEGVTTEMEYDSYGNQTKLIDPNAGETEYKYNAFGELIQQTDANGNIFTITYNSAGQITQKQCNNNSQFTTTYTYITSGAQKGLLKKETLGNGHYKEYFYNDLGAVTQLDEKIDGTVYTHKYTYDDYGRTETYEYPSGYTITNEYDSDNGFKKAVYEAGNTPIWSLTGSNYVNEMGQILNQTLGNYLTTTKTFDSDFELTNIATKKSDNNILFNHIYSFNHNTGNLISRDDKTGGRNISELFYTYDEKNRLKDWMNYNYVDKNFNIYNIEYANNGNILSKTDAGTLYTYSDKPHAVVEIQDENGNTVISHDEQNIIYNPFQKTATVSQDNGFYNYTITYGTDAQRKKNVYKIDNIEQFTRIYSGLYEKETTAAGTREYHYIPTPSGTVAVNIIENEESTTYFLLKDYLGSILKVVDDSGTTIEERSFDAWGNHRDPDTWQLTDFNSDLGITRGYTGHEHLPAEFQIINMNGRCYDPVIGRVLSPDNYVVNASNAQDYNRYSYARNNPLKYTDPDGEWVHLVIGAIFGGFTNWAMNGAQFSWKGLGYFGVGAAAGALGAGIGGGISSALPIAGQASGGFVAGFLGTSAATTATSSFVSGALIGGGSGLASGFTTGFGNGLLGGQNIGQAMWSGTKAGLIGGGTGALLGGIGGGIDAKMHGRKFLSGATVQRTTLAEHNIPVVGQRGDMNCGPATAEAVDGSFGGSMTQEQIRNLPALERYPNTVPLGDITVWDAYGNASGHTVNHNVPANGELSNVLSNMQNGNRVALNLKASGNVGHSVVMQRVVQQTTTKINGTVTQKMLYYVMNPANGGYIQRISSHSILDAYRIFYILP